MSRLNTPLILSAAITGFGYYTGNTQQAQRLVELDHYRALLQDAEAGLLSFVLFEDERALAADRSFGRIDALSLAARLAPESRHVGLAISVPTTYSEPFHVSRELATLDFVSRGRAAWHLTTTHTADEQANYGHAPAPSEQDRRSITTEFVEVSRKLWDSWEDDAVITDAERGLYLDPHKLHHINHAGRHFKVRGPQITYRPPQGQVVVIASEHGDPGVPLDVNVADVVILRSQSLAEAKQAVASYRSAASAAGRDIRILQSVIPILAASESEAHQRAQQLEQSYSARYANPAPALRLVGTAAQVAAELAAWQSDNAADGFHFLPAVLPHDLGLIARELVPELQQLGVLPTAYRGSTLRDQLGFERPVSQYEGVPSDAHTAYQR